MVKMEQQPMSTTETHQVVVAISRLYLHYHSLLESPSPGLVVMPKVAVRPERLECTARVLPAVDPISVESVEQEVYTSHDLAFAHQQLVGYEP